MPRTELKNPTGPHLTIEKFRRFELQLERFLSTYPAIYSVKPTEMAASTFVVRIREAANYFLENPETQSSINWTTFREAWRSVVVTRNGENIIICPPGSQGTSAIAFDPIKRAIGLTFTDPSLNTLNALCVLLSEQALNDPVLLIGNVPPFQPTLGCVMVPNEDGTFTLL